MEVNTMATEENAAQETITAVQTAFIEAEAAYTSQVTGIAREQEAETKTTQKTHAEMAAAILKQNESDIATIRTKVAEDVRTLEHQTAANIADHLKDTTDAIASIAAKAQDKIAAAALEYQKLQQQLKDKLNTAQVAHMELVKVRTSKEAVAKLEKLNIAKSTAIQAVRNIMAEKLPADVAGQMAFDARLRLAQQLEAKAIKIYDENFAAIQDDHLIEMLKN